MDQHQHQIRALLNRVRTRWRRLIAVRALVRTMLAVAGVFAVALGFTAWAGTPTALVAIALAAAVLVLAAIVWGLWPAREYPSDLRVARFLEEHDPSLDDRLASAVDLVGLKSDAALPAMAVPMMADAAARASAIDPKLVVPRRALRRAWLGAAAAALVLAAVAFVGRGPARRTVDAVSITMFPTSITLDVTPGTTRIQAGSQLAVEARLRGNRAPAVAQLLRADDTPAASGAAGQSDAVWRPADMASGPSGAFTLGLGPVNSSFKYRVVAGTVTSPVYDVTVAWPPRVTRVDVEYLDSMGRGLPPRIEEDSGDIYAPAGTNVRLHVHTDREAATGQLDLGAGSALNLAPGGANELTATIRVAGDDSYRIALADREGLKSSGDTEYFIRTLEDRPPEVRILKPARDRSVTKLDEVEIQAQAEDDFGIERLELAYAVRGGAEKTVPLPIPRRATAVTGDHTIYLEDLDVEPGDFVSYYVKARDVGRGRQSSESRSDIFFLEIAPFDQEFTLAQSQAMAAAGRNQSVDELVAAQKEVIVATWKLDRRAQAVSGAKSADDIRSVARAEAELKRRVEETASSFRESTMRDPRRPNRPTAPGGTAPPRAGQTLAEEDAMTAAATALGQAVQSLDALKTSQALPSEMEALNHLLKAQADLKNRQIARQPSSGAGSNRATQDLSSLFDKELQRQQQTNYESTSTEQRENADSMLEKIKELARRQDELLKQQQELERKQMTAEALKRELERLSREQSALRQRAEEMARQMGSQQSQGGQDSSQQMRGVSEAMREAASELGRDNPGQASARGSRALEELRDLQRQYQSGAPDEKRRARGEMQLEARQLADAERQAASELHKIAPGEAGRDALRRLAGDQERMAERAERLQQGLGQQKLDQAKEIERQRIPERMRQSANQLRTQAEKPGATPEKSPANATANSMAASQEEMARALDKLAESLSAADQPGDDQSRRLSDQLGRAQELRERIESLTREVERLAGQADSNAARGNSGQGRQSRGSSPNGEAIGTSQLQAEINRQLQETRRLLEEMRRDDTGFAPGGIGFTFEGQGMTLSAPGTEAFKQDFTRWEQLRKQATQALDLAESSLTQKLQARQAQDRLAAGVEDKAPASYQQQVDSYFKALADRKKP
jgi:hypothetical protein